MTKPLKNLKNLYLPFNQLTTFVLDLKEILPKIHEVALDNNQIWDLQINESSSNYSLSLQQLNVSENNIHNIETYEWIFKNQGRINVSWDENFPRCDCNTRQTLVTLNKASNELYDKNFVEHCQLPLPEMILIHFHALRCVEDIKEEEEKRSCAYYEGGNFLALSVTFMYIIYFQTHVQSRRRSLTALKQVGHPLLM